MIIGDHDRGCDSRANEPARVVPHSEVDVKANFFAMMSAVARYPYWKHRRSTREVEHLRAVELDDACSIFLDTFQAFIAVSSTVRIRASWPNTGSQFSSNTFRLSVSATTAAQNLIIWRRGTCDRCGKMENVHGGGINSAFPARPSFRGRPWRQFKPLP